VENFN